MDSQARNPGLSPITREWLKSLKESWKVPTIQRSSSRGTEIWKKQEQLQDTMEVRRPHSLVPARLQQSPVNRPMTPSSGYYDRCICQRPKTLVSCQRCNFRILSRVTRTCPAHPRTLFLMDLNECPECFSSEDLAEENAANLPN